jgi:hypothetical protein
MLQRVCPSGGGRQVVEVVVPLRRCEDRQDCDVGTSIGVWRGTLTFTGNVPTWTWQPFVNNLPPVAVQDLAIYRQGTLKLLRAATQSRGVWEVDLATEIPPSVLFLRVHANDSRRRLPVPLLNPSRVGPPRSWVWFASPDIRIRPASGQPAPPFPPELSKQPWTEDPVSRIKSTDFDLWTFQTALHKQDPRCRPTGDWTGGAGGQFDECVARLPHNPGEPPRGITPRLWTSIVTQAAVFAEPWDGEPSEADLLELIVERRDRADPVPQEPLAGPPQASLLKKLKYKVDVLVHYRDPGPLPASQVKVTLLRVPQTFPTDPGRKQIRVPAKTTLPANFSSVVAQLITGAGTQPPTGWEIADPGHPVRSPLAAVDVTAPRVVTFDVDFSSFAKDKMFALLAIAHRVPDQGADPGPTLAGASLEDLVLNNVQAAARIVKMEP